MLHGEAVALVQDFGDAAAMAMPPIGLVAQQAARAGFRGFGSLGECKLGLYGFRELISRGAVDIVQLDLAWSGGFSEGRRIAAYAHAHHRMVAPHAFAGAVLLMASLHFAAAIPNGLNLEWDQNPNAIREELLKEPLRLEPDGTVKVPERPGLGIELDRAAVERYRIG